MQSVAKRLQDAMVEFEQLGDVDLLNFVGGSERTYRRFPPKNVSLGVSFLKQSAGSAMRELNLARCANTLFADVLTKAESQTEVKVEILNEDGSVHFPDSFSHAVAGLKAELSRLESVVSYGSAIAIGRVGS